jgi:phosphoglycerate dehydrogenase-like enzyme
MYEPSPAHLSALQQAAPEAVIAAASCEQSARAAIAKADAVLGNRYFLQSLDAAERLRWMQSNSMGVDLLVESAARRQFVLTNARGVYDDEVADHALALVLALARGIPLACEQQRRRVWQRPALRALRGLRALLLGWGGVARAIASRLHAFGVELTAVRRSECSTPDERDPIPVLGATNAWRELLPQTDVLILALPKTPQTVGLIGAHELAQLPRNALVINVGRGGTLDETALLQALQSEQLGGAALDVFEREPLAHDSPLWQAPQLLITAHLGRSPELPPYRWEAIFIENLRRFATGAPLLNVVDHTAGY